MFKSMKIGDTSLPVQTIYRVFRLFIISYTESGVYTGKLNKVDNTTLPIENSIKKVIHYTAFNVSYTVIHS